MIHFKLRYSQRKHGENLGQNGLHTTSDIFYPPKIAISYDMLSFHDTQNSDISKDTYMC